MELKPNKSVEKFTLGLGVLKTIKPMLLALNTFPHLRDLRI